MKTFKLFACATVAVAALSAAAPQAQAVTFVLNSLNAGTAAGTNARKGFEIAAAYWSSVLTNNSTVTLNIGFSALGTGILGSTSSGTNIQINQDYYSALAANASSTVDASAVATLRPLTTDIFGDTSAVTARTNALNATNNGYLDTATRIDSDGSQNSSTISMNSSLGKAMGFTSDVFGNPLTAVDGSVQFSTGFAFDFDPTDGIDSDKFDFIGVAIHEIGHALGFRSGVDVVDSYTSPGGTARFAGTALQPALEGQTIMTQLDLFRYGEAGLLDWTTQGQAYFSIDGGVSQLYGDSRMEMGRLNGGRGRQASHFYDSAANVPQIGVMDPTSGYGQMQEITALDIAAFDAIGWRTSFDANLNQGYRYTTAEAYRQFAAQATPVVPEPSTWMMMILGFGAVGFAMRSKRRTTTVRFA
ncbi:NF038122 family metalloprotease [Sphingomonas sp. RS2018]